MRDKCLRKVFTKIVFPQPVGPHTIDVQGCFQRTSILRNEQTIFVQDFKSKKEKCHFRWFLERVKKIILREDKLINAPTGAPSRGGRVLAPAYTRVSLSAESTAADEKLISPRCASVHAHERIFARVKEICDRRIFLSLNEYATSSSISLPMPLPRCRCEGKLS